MYKRQVRGFAIFVVEILVTLRYNVFIKTNEAVSYTHLDVYKRQVQKYKLAASIKHFPGDGRDERDQHLVTSINDFSCEEWDQTYGAAYQACIDAGALTVMVGHIMQPAYIRHFNPEIKDEDMMPATLSPELLQDLLRGKLGFNGLICTDATSMAGFTIPMSREKAVPLSIASGADMFLFTKNLAEDFEFMCKGVEEGVDVYKRQPRMSVSASWCWMENTRASMC